ncbi:CDP-glucose 4,6-dehydratase [Candidatus Pelagibacter sp.]|nr:CDP-glucose 4,6-dehydratase [Candidatus Pelagibacter sp.]MDA9754486.1 CDP-glucose 4,6-dehydratase [Candidatus Pelagibacter sp.]
MRNFFKNKKILITGHTGFMGGWLALALSRYSNKLYGISLPGSPKKNFYNIIGIKKLMKKEFFFDLSKEKSIKIINKIDFDIVFHLAAQPLVGVSFKETSKTFKSNIMGTVNVMEAIKIKNKKQVIIVVTSDKVYQNDELGISFKENSSLGGKDPYSGSKSCQDIIAQAYKHSFFNNTNKHLGIARIGNIIGGGDWSKDRLIPDIFRDLNKSNILIRNQNAIRPWQHVIETTYYICQLALQISNDRNLAGIYNFGPDKANQCSVKEICIKIEKRLKKNNIKLTFNYLKKNLIKEANILRLNNNKMKKILNLKPKYNINKTLNLTCEWYLNYKQNNIKKLTLKQISNYFL